MGTLPLPGAASALGSGERHPLPSRPPMWSTIVCTQDNQRSTVHEMSSVGRYQMKRNVSCVQGLAAVLVSTLALT